MSEMAEKAVSSREENGTHVWGEAGGTQWLQPATLPVIGFPETPCQ